MSMRKTFPTGSLSYTRREERTRLTYTSFPFQLARVHTVARLDSVDYYVNWSSLDNDGRTRSWVAGKKFFFFSFFFFLNGNAFATRPGQVMDTQGWFTRLNDLKLPARRINGWSRVKLSRVLPAAVGFCVCTHLFFVAKISQIMLWLLSVTCDTSLWRYGRYEKRGGVWDGLKRSFCVHGFWVVCRSLCIYNVKVPNCAECTWYEKTYKTCKYSDLYNTW